MGFSIFIRAVGYILYFGLGINKLWFFTLQYKHIYLTRTT